MSPVHDEEDIKGVAGTLYGGAFLHQGFKLRRSHFTRFTFRISCGGYGGWQFVIGCDALAEPSCFTRRPQRFLLSFWP